MRCLSILNLRGAVSRCDSPCSEEYHLFRFALVSLILFGGTPGARPSTPSDCVAAYQSYLEELKRKRMSSQRRAALHRWALRVYDACETGDLEVDVEELFERLERRKY